MLSEGNEIEPVGSGRQAPAQQTQSVRPDQMINNVDVKTASNTRDLDPSSNRVIV